MTEGWETCSHCKKEYYVRSVKFPIKDDAHDVFCPYCNAKVGHVDKGTTDYFLDTKEHIVKWQQEEASKPLCPKCGQKMTKRQGYSEFWGCSNFPDCDGKRKI